MYWNNPIIKATVNGGVDPVVTAQHQGQHCLFYAPDMPLSRMVKLVTLQETCDLANQYIENFDTVKEPGNLDKIANAVRINQFVHSLRTQGNFKPILLYYTGTWTMDCGTGGSRLMAAECIPELQSFPVFISTHSKYKDQLRDLEEIVSLKQFATHCKASEHTQFYFRLTAPEADYGINWYEAALETTSVPSNDQCLVWLRNYINRQPAGFCFTPEWFNQLIDWTTVGHQAAKS
jgi:hypothetical protein